MVKPICYATGCERESRLAGLCGMHHQRKLRHGDPNTPRVRALPGAPVIYGDGYVTIMGKYEHIRIAERVLGRPLPKGAVVHHVNEIRHDNRPSNLVICPSHSYHRMLHHRMRAYDA
jgi:hypothetical protein